MAGEIGNARVLTMLDNSKKKTVRDAKPIPPEFDLNQFVAIEYKNPTARWDIFPRTFNPRLRDALVLLGQVRIPWQKKKWKNLVFDREGMQIFYYLPLFTSAEIKLEERIYNGLHSLFVYADNNNGFRQYDTPIASGRFHDAVFDRYSGVLRVRYKPFKFEPYESGTKRPVKAISQE